jgi:transglutaminase-like putative cysteine protease
MNKKLLEFIFFVVLITVMVMSLNMAVADSTGMDISFYQLLKYTFLVVLTAAVLIKYPIAIFGAAAVAIGGGLYVYVKQLVLPADIISYFSSFITWLPQYVIGYEAFDMKYSLMFAMLYILLATFLISIIVFNKKGYGFLVALGTGAFAFFWFIYVPKARLYLFYYLFASLLLYSYNVYDKKKLEWINAESKIDKSIEIKWVFNSLIIILISITISQFAILDIKPLQWNWLSEKTLQVFPFIENWRNDNFDNFSFGFGSKYGIDAAGYRTARLGGPVKLSEKVMLIIETEAMEEIYLRGTVKDFYNGSSWGKTKKSSVQHSTDEDIPWPFLGAAEIYSRDISITHQNLITSTIFAPNTLSKVQHKLGRYYIDQDDEAVFPRVIVKRDKYTVTSKIPYVDVKQLKNIKTAELSPDIYKQLPDNISQRVRKLALDITSKYHNDYDKAKAIEKYLRNNYKYSLTPSEVPKGSEFVDYFLFEDKEGYCTYFATSMAVLLRAADIPCRYVEGFLAKYDNSHIRNVAGTDAHAWVEVNFGPYGWLTFEATPAYPLLGFRSQGEVPAAPIPESDPNKPIVPIDPSDSNPIEKNLDEEDEVGGGADIQQTKELSLITRIILAILAILIIRVSYLLLKRTYIEMKLKKSSGKQYSVEYFKDVLRYLKKINVVMLKEETMREYWYKVKYTLDEDFQNGDEIIGLLEKLRYSGDNIDDAAKNQLEEYRKKLKKFVTARLGKVKALISYYIIGL